MNQLDWTAAHTSLMKAVAAQMLASGWSQLLQVAAVSKWQSLVIRVSCVTSSGQLKCTAASTAVHLYTSTPVLYTHRPAQPVHNIEHANYYAIVLRRVEFQRYLKYAEIWKYAEEKNQILKHFIESITLLRNS